VGVTERFQPAEKRNMNTGEHARRGNYSYLLLALVLLLLANPFVVESGRTYPRIIFHAVSAATLLIGVWSLIQKRVWFLLGLSLALLSLVLNSLVLFSHQPALIYSIIAVELLFFGMTLAIAFHDVMLEGAPDLNKIVGAICIYLLLGTIWALLYLVVNLAQPGAFSGVVSSAPEQQSSELMYLSFITLTTLGYGDIAPATPLSRMLALIEAIAGQFFLAILVAGLVGAHIANRNNPP
jgi:voltage-gated potassium channel